METKATNIELYHGDCLKVMQAIPSGSVDLILCDLPYGVTACKWDVVLPFEPMWAEYRRVIKPNGAIVLFAAQPFTTSLISSNRRDFRYCWYWRKSNVSGGVYAKVQPMRCIEDIAVFYQRAPTYHPQGIQKLRKPKRRAPALSNVYNRQSRNSQTHTGYPNHFLEFGCDVQLRDRLHPTQKPVALLEYLVQTYTNVGETVLDNCMGSGSTGVACINTGRRFIGIEMDEHYFQVAQARIEKARQSKRKGQPSEKVL